VHIDTSAFLHCNCFPCAPHGRRDQPSDCRLLMINSSTLLTLQTCSNCVPGVTSTMLVAMLSHTRQAAHKLGELYVSRAAADVVHTEPMIHRIMPALPLCWLRGALTWCHGGKKGLVPWGGCWQAAGLLWRAGAGWSAEGCDERRALSGVDRLLVRPSIRCGCTAQDPRS
jgi:hypothetical protein